MNTWLGTTNPSDVSTSLTLSTEEDNDALCFCFSKAGRCAALGVQEKNNIPLHSLYLSISSLLSFEDKSLVNKELLCLLFFFYVFFYLGFNANGLLRSRPGHTEYGDC